TSFFLIVHELLFFGRVCALPDFTVRGRLEYRPVAPGKATACKTAYFYDREARRELAWGAVAGYGVNDRRRNDDANGLSNIAGVGKIIGDKDFEAWFPFGYSLYASSRDNPVSFEIKMIR